MEGIKYLNTSDVTDMSCMFYRCEKLTALELSGFRTDNVTSMYYMFRDCKALTSLDLSNFNTRNVTDMGTMFVNCSSLSTLDLSNFNTQNITSMSSMFSGCNSLTSIDLSNFNTQNVTSMNSMFSNCRNLTTLDLSNFDTQNVTDMSYMFSGCFGLANIDLSNFNTENVTDMRYMFGSCTSLTVLDLSNFSITDPQAFLCYACTNLTDITLGNRITILGSSAFKSCTNLKKIHANNEFPPYIYDNTFESVTKETAELIVPKGTKTTYAAAEGWKEFYNIIEEDDTVTAINGIMNNAHSGQTTIYTTNGQRVGRTYGNGIFIMNGRKVAVK
ncbi:MAG: BspA family leucine-rich repeat surface protein [Bacteroidales bacterium]|nr:BspA family leucine-rich repeat surface protein [Bacteroidales bacterium]MCM1147005.1 BspA family leucine-rich repeat surface protein [Bacteroidales bacterium]MCM1205862.1 BspA family leucine-rich repeat surface protein [Bacillota bacterium]MCM1509897.1 BspA family leucine-rich repeat surface protein [Clostridium sp.]